MKIMVIGLGSMGRRRLRLLRMYNNNFEIIGVDGRLDRRAQAKDMFDIETFSTVEDVLENQNVKCAFISTPPASHNNIIKKCLSNGLHVFTELNLIADGYEENIDLSQKMGLTLFLSSTLLYRKEIRAIKDKISHHNGNLNYIYHVGQYLPDWHPWETYKDFFVNNKRTNGCREIFAIELPWITHVFGDITSFSVEKSKNSTLDIDYNDNYLLIINHVTGHKGVFAVDVISRKAVRNLEVYGQDLYLNWDGSPMGLNIYDSDKKKNVNINLYDNIDKLSGYETNIIENAYYDEIVDFFNAININTKPLYSFQKDLDIIRIIDEIEQYE